MNKSDRKNELNELIISIKGCIIDLNESRKKEENLIIKIDELLAMTEDYSLGENLFDTDSMYAAITSGLIESTSFYDIHEALTDFKSNIDDYISELSEAKAEELEDVYDGWDDMTSLFDITDEDVLVDVITNLEEALSLLEGRVNEKRY